MNLIGRPPLALVLRKLARPAAILLAQETAQFPRHLVPLHHATHIEKLLLAELAQLIAMPAPSVLTEVAQRMPDVEQAQEIRIRFIEDGVRFVGGLFPLGRPLAHIHDAQPGHDDNHFAKDLALARCQQHSPEPWVEREACEAPPDFGEIPLPGIERSHLLQSAKSLGDRTGRGRIEEGELSHVPQVQGLHAEDHPRERRTAESRDR